MPRHERKKRSKEVMLKSIHRYNERQSTRRYKTGKKERYSGVSEPERQVELCKQANQKTATMKPHIRQKSPTELTLKTCLAELRNNNKKRKTKAQMRSINVSYDVREL